MKIIKLNSALTSTMVVLINQAATMLGSR